MRLFSIVVGVLLGLSAPAGAQGLKPLRVLFVGNSYTAANDLPKMIATLAAAGRQRPIVFEAVIPGGCTFRKHFTDGVAVEKIRAGKWDVVVLQEQSQMPIINPKETLEFGGKLAAEAKKVGARVLLYQTWARQAQPMQQDKLTNTYGHLAFAAGADVAPAGEAWRQARAAIPKLALYHPDGSHPSKAGTYLTACVFYAALYHRSPQGLPGKAGGLPQAEARLLQAIAWKMVQAGGPNVKR